MLCGRPARLTSRFFSGAGKWEMSPRLLTVAMSLTAFGFGWHGGGGCCAYTMRGTSVARIKVASVISEVNIAMFFVVFIIVFDSSLISISDLKPHLIEQRF